MSIDKVALGEAIKKVRLARGLTQKELAAAAGLSSTALIEQGRRSVSVETLNALAQALRIPSACLTILGTRSTSENEAAGEFVKSLQDLISAVVLTQAKLHINAKGEQSKREIVEEEQKQFSEIAKLFGTAIPGKKATTKEKRRFVSGL